MALVRPAPRQNGLAVRVGIAGANVFAESIVEQEVSWKTKETVFIRSSVRMSPHVAAAYAEAPRATSQKPESGWPPCFCRSRTDRPGP